MFEEKFFENLDVWTVDHCILYSFLPGFSLWQRGIDSTKQTMVYDRITFFIKKSTFFFRFVLGAKNLGKYSKIGRERKFTKDSY